MNTKNILTSVVYKNNSTIDFDSQFMNAQKSEQIWLFLSTILRRIDLYLGT